MARKTNSGKRSTSTKIHIKYVKRAKMWCKTYFDGDKQIQEWSVEKSV